MNISDGQDIFDRLSDGSQLLISQEYDRLKASECSLQKLPDLFKGRGRLLEGDTYVRYLRPDGAMLKLLVIPGKSRRLKRPPSDSDDYCDPIEEGDEVPPSRATLPKGYRGESSQSFSVGGVPWDIQSTVGTDEGLEVKCGHCHLTIGIQQSVYGFSPKRLDRVDHFCPICADELGIIPLEDGNPDTYGM